MKTIATEKQMTRAKAAHKLNKERALLERAYQSHGAFSSAYVESQIKIAELKQIIGIEEARSRSNFWRTSRAFDQPKRLANG